MSEFTKEEVLALANEIDALNPRSDAAWPELCERAATALRTLAPNTDAKPVAWLCEEAKSSWIDKAGVRQFANWARHLSTDRPTDHPARRNFVPLYAAPPHHATERVTGWAQDPPQPLRGEA